MIAGTDGILPFIGVSAFSKAGNAHLEAYVYPREENAPLIILVGDHSEDSTWNDVCMAAVSDITPH